MGVGDGAAVAVAVAVAVGAGGVAVPGATVGTGTVFWHAVSTIVMMSAQKMKIVFNVEPLPVERSKVKWKREREKRISPIL